MQGRAPEGDPGAGERLPPEDGRAWRITHEHVSIPIDPATMRIWVPSDKDQPA
ncbi:hypothetical protein GCM10017667_44900 [Streptomyces filamentosus]|uniref:Uncharacterized protein n=1 Tax=Streptomyces filamentosus TaxID=67294 RepID=A0A919EQH8_STRFL|nr:hypothetical protein GCM10017667_44900 [Streptomyces filamentosus]